MKASLTGRCEDLPGNEPYYARFRAIVQPGVTAAAIFRWRSPPGPFILFAETGGSVTRMETPTGDQQDGAVWAGWMVRAQQGDAEAYRELLQALLGPVRSFIQRHYPGIRDREDVVQDTLITLHRIRHTYDPARPFAPWLFTIVRRRCIDHLRRSIRVQQRELQEEAIVALAAAPERDPEAEGIEVAEQVLASLGEREREVIRLLKIEDLPVKAVAAQLGLSESNVKVIASRGYARLRQQWKQHHENR